MKAAVVFEAGKAPAYSEYEEPIPLEGEVCIDVTASALTNFTKVRAAGKHYSFTAQPPFVVGIDGIGRLETGAVCILCSRELHSAGWLKKQLYLRLNA